MNSEYPKNQWNY